MPASSRRGKKTRNTGLDLVEEMERDGVSWRHLAVSDRARVKRCANTNVCRFREIRQIDAKINTALAALPDDVEALPPDVEQVVTEHLIRRRELMVDVSIKINRNV